MTEMTPAEWRQQYGPEWYKTEEYKAHCHEIWLRVTTPEDRAWFQSDEYRELGNRLRERSRMHASCHCERCTTGGCIVQECCATREKCAHGCWCEREHPEKHTRPLCRPGDPDFAGLTGEKVAKICTEALLWEQIKDVAG